jgi:hypothetical protein
MRPPDLVPHAMPPRPFRSLAGRPVKHRREIELRIIAEHPGRPACFDARTWAAYIAQAADGARSLHVDGPVCFRDGSPALSRTFRVCEECTPEYRLRMLRAGRCDSGATYVALTREVDVQLRYRSDSVAYWLWTWFRAHSDDGLTIADAKVKVAGAHLPVRSTTVESAMRQLAHDGWIVHEGDGIYVASVTLAELSAYSRR